MQVTGPVARQRYYAKTHAIMTLVGSRMSELSKEVPTNPDEGGVDALNAMCYASGFLDAVALYLDASGGEDVAGAVEKVEGKFHGILSGEYGR